MTLKKGLLLGLAAVLGVLIYLLWSRESKRSTRGFATDTEGFRKLEMRLVPQIFVDSATSSMDLSLLQPYFDGQHRVVALGESTHGSAEMIKWRFYFTKYLVENLGYNFIGIETTYSEAQAVNSFVKGDSAITAISALKGLRYPLLFNKEMLTFIHWLRDYNERANQKVEFFGFDIPYSTKPQQNVVHYLVQTHPRLGHYADSCFATILKYGVVKNQSSGPRYVLTDRGISPKVQAVRRLVKAHSEELIARSSVEGLDRCLHNLDLIDMAAQRVSARIDNVEFMNFRDSSMHENVRWMARLDSDASKTIIWAHNEHLKRTLSNGRTTLAFYLAQSLGEDFYCVGSDFGRGSVSFNSARGLQTRSVPRLDNCFAKIDSLLSLPIYFFDFRGAGREVPETNILIHAMTGNLVGSQLTHLHIDKEFDAFIYVPESSPLTPIPGDNY